MMVSFCAILFPMRCLGEILDLIKSVPGVFPIYSCSIRNNFLQRNDNVTKSCQLYSSTVSVFEKGILNIQYLFSIFLYTFDSKFHLILQFCSNFAHDLLKGR